MFKDLKIRLKLFAENHNTLLNNLLSVSIGLFFALFVYAFLARPFLVVGLSMYPQFNAQKGIIGDYIIADVLSYNFREPERFDVVIAKNNCDTKADYVLKRIIGLPNDDIKIINDGVYINEKLIQELYLNKEAKLIDTEVVYKDFNRSLKQDEFLLLGDNRNNSLDDRMCGPTNRSLLIGRAFLRLYPFTQIEVLPGNID